MNKPKPRQAKSTEDNSGQVKIELLRAARRLLSTGGRESATMRAICAEVGVTPPTLYHYYGDLNGLHKAAIDETYQQVANSYHASTQAKGPLQGVRDGWLTFLRFAHEEPNMCRIVMQQIMAGEPPSLVADTLHGVTEDLKQFHAGGQLKFDPEDATQMLWMSALGTISFTISDMAGKPTSYPRLQEAMIEATLDALFDRQSPVEKISPQDDTTNGAIPCSDQVMSNS